MKRLLTLFLVIGVLGIYGQTTEGELKIQTDTTQNADTIIKADTIGTENLQIEGDTAASIKDSLFTEEIKKDQQEIIEKKVSPISCCLSGKNQSEQKSKWSFGIGYCNETSLRLGALTEAWESNDVLALPWPKDWPLIMSNGISLCFERDLNKNFSQGFDFSILKSFTLHENKYLNCSVDDTVKLIGNDYDLCFLNLDYFNSLKIFKLSLGITYLIGVQNLLQGYWDGWGTGNFTQVVTNRMRIDRQYLGPNSNVGIDLFINKVRVNTGLSFSYLSQIYAATNNLSISDIGKLPIKKIGIYFCVTYQF
ncbi:MAG: hypothetical protein PHW02_03755 [bacterium]|nr:hypothetical protein [bacterium]